jgi:hypothetical protein
MPDDTLHATLHAVIHAAWRKATCEERDRFYAEHDDALVPGAARTDLGGEFGEPEIYTEWWDRATEVPMLRDWRFPQISGDKPDRRPCEHYLWQLASAENTTDAEGSNVD